MCKKSILFIALICLSAQLMAQSPITVAAHRGFRGLHPENTIGSMQRALDYGAILELDLAVTADKQMVVSHDAVLNRKITLDPEGRELAPGKKTPLYGMIYDDLKKYDVGGKPNPDFPSQVRYKAQIPLFSTLIDSVEQYAILRGLKKPVYLVETKLKIATDNQQHPGPQEFVDLLLTVIFEKGIQDRIIIQSFDPRTLQIIHRKHPEIRLAFLAKKETTLEENIAWLGFVPAYYSADAQYITAALAEKCRKLGMATIVGNCNDYQQFLRIEKLGIRTFISDYPLSYLQKAEQP